MRAILSLGFLWVAAAPAAPAQRLSPPLGSQVRVSVSGSATYTGELLAAEGDSLWLLHQGRVTGVPLTEGVSVRVDRGGMGAEGALTWSLVAGIVSGAVLTAACSSVDGADCGDILVGTAALWALVGAISAPSLHSARYLTLTSPQAEQLRPRARFPQGLPAAARDSLVPARPDAP
ncbi:MAG: hypothetical protein ACREL9_07590 [Gemmatimonadales bacterium]